MKTLGYIGAVIVAVLLVAIPVMVYGVVGYVLVHFIKKLW